ncbi:acetoacetate--CoA ligase [Extensimonas sp. H3M7-6]|uniref:acetoacetate--CoA ligase n=1 Tax=Extensimonas soli TaxID=3031322 RepID=UPI0023DC716D|nr:acetoacetate--CoA ligase [Extensimonas sp. H3M7-6]MDF1482350.1 acetoacetate--CoA ligase [Extensimonas sp. H3M7-6]
MSSETPEILWTPSPERVAKAELTRFQQWLEREKGLRFADYAALWQWSVDDLEGFWSAIVEYFDLPLENWNGQVLTERKMPGAQWFVGARTNYARQVFRHATDARPAIVFRNEAGERSEMSWRTLQEQVAALAQWLREAGVQPGDRVAAYLPNIPQTMVAFLAVVSVGAIWSVCSPDMGAPTVLDRFRQIEPKVLIAVDGYQWGGRRYERSDTVAMLLEGLPSVQRCIFLPYLDANARPDGLRNAVLWSETLAKPAELQIASLPFEHPLWIVYSSGTTGLPKPIVHGHGGIVLEQVKLMRLHNDLGPEDNFHWFSTTGWVMWNCQIGGLLVGATACVYDGNPAWPDYGTLWRFAGDVGLHFLGASAAFFAACQKQGVEPQNIADLRSLRGVGSTGSPLAPESYHWLADRLGREVWINPISGGTDFAGAFVGGVPTLPVYIGEMQGRCLGARVEAFNEQGQPVLDEVGELVCTAPMPSMPLYFWNDPGHKRYLDSYFDMFPGVWRHGDWIRITPRGGAIIYGRSDTTINRHGVRMGTSDIYSVVEALPEVLDSLVVDLEYLGRESYMPMFVVLRPGATLDQGLIDRIKNAIRTSVSPRHVPDEVFVVPEVPRTLTGKKLELPIKKLLLGHPLEKVVNRDALANSASLDWFFEFARRRAAQTQ